ncbi:MULTISPECIES: hypothetical protein [Halobacterium]|uniref:hypothetical protein n=1 Tax=Halobacterium TaxID=2239 RepID=UPI00073E7A53|nr:MULTISPECIES: hypothetical protein [Halobacterium]MCG1001907.1 hypothetical protein [Halobacterium noricense]
MKPEIRRTDTWSFNGGRDIVERKGLKQELPAIAEAYIEHGGGNQNLSERRELLNPVNWVQEVSVKFETTTDFDLVSRRASFDAYKDGVVVEHESGEQMRANWHLMKMEAAHRDPSVFSSKRVADVGVLLIPSYVNFPTLGRTENDVQAVLEQYFNFSIPLFVWEYPTT